MIRMLFTCCLLLVNVSLEIPPGGANNTSSEYVLTVNCSSEIFPDDSHAPDVTNLSSRIVQYGGQDVLICPGFSCVGRCNVPPASLETADCFCDDICSFYGDCCFDIDEACGPNSTVMPEHLRHLSSQKPRCSNIIQDKYALLIDQCTESWSHDTTRHRCEDEHHTDEEDVFLILPVTAKDSYIAHKNIYCALCNNVEPENVELWEMKLNCPLCEDFNPIVQGQIMLTQIRGLIAIGCILSIQPGNEETAKHARYCNPNFVNTCPLDVDANDTSGYKITASQASPKDAPGPSCMKYTAYVISEARFVRQVVKNTHCAICLNASSSTSDLSCPFPSELLFVQLPRILVVPPFSLILDFNGYHWKSESHTIDSELEAARCYSGWFYIDGDCREGRCENGFHRDEERCLPNIHEDQGLLTISFSINAEQTDRTLIENFIVDDAKDRGVSIDNITSEFHHNALTVDCGDAVSPSVNFPTVLDVNIRISTNVSLYVTLVYLDDLIVNSSLFHLINLKAKNGGSVTAAEFICDNLETFTLNNESNEMIFMTADGDQSKATEVFFEISWINRCDNGLVRATIEKTVIGCALPESRCLFVPVSPKELAQLEDALADGTVNYSQTQVTEIDGQTHVCGEVFQGGKQIHKVTVNLEGDLVESIITAVLLSLSMTALLCTVLTYCLIPRLRSLPGKIVLSLSVALLLAQALFLTIQSATEIPWLCEVIAAVEHYLWLSAFTWSNVLALDLEITLTGSTKVPKSHESEHIFILYFLYSWGIPAVVVSTAILVSHFTTLPVKYGNENLCWLMYNEALFVSFALPVGIVVIINCGLLSRAIYVIWKVGKLVKNANIVQDQKFKAFLYAKLFFLMGFTWIFGFLGTILGNKPLMYIFTIFNSLQGVYIFLAFMANKRVLGFYGKLAMYRIANRLFSSRGSTSTTNESKVG